MSQYDLTKAQLTQIYDQVNIVVGRSADYDVSNREVIQALNDLHSELERNLPAGWWTNRDHQLDDVKTFVKSVEDVSRRKERVVEFTNHMTTLILDSDLHIEP